ncbi:hypothetical protein Tco_1180593 [Tanacetum coccineum]
MPSTANEDISKSSPFYEAKPIDPQNTKGSAFNLGVDIEDQVDKTQSTRFEMSDPNQNKSKTSSEVELGTEPLLLTTFADLQALLDSEDELKDESDEEMYEDGEEIDEEFL